MADVTKSAIIQLLFKDNASKEFSNALSNMSKSSKGTESAVESLKKSFDTFRNVIVGVAGAATVAGGAILKMASDASVVEQSREIFKNLSKAVGVDAVEAFNKLRESTKGLVSDSDLLMASNRLLSMGLASNSDQLNEIITMATKLGKTFGLDAYSAVENFSLLLANQSVLRLDSFGISGAKVRDRMEELAKQFPNMSKEAIFMQATMEEGRKSMAAMGDVQLSLKDRITQMKVAMSNFTEHLGVKLIPYIDKIIVYSQGLYKEWSSKLQPVVLNLRDEFVKLWDSIKDDVMPIFEKISSLIKDNFTPLIVGLTTVIVAMGVAWTANMAAAAVSTAAAMAPVLALVGAVAVLYEAWSENWGGIQDKARGVVSWIKDDAYPRLKSFGDDLMVVFKGVAEFVAPKINDIVEIFSLLGETVSIISSKIYEVVRPVFEGIVKVVGASLGYVASFIRDNMDNIKQVFSGAWNAILSTFNIVWESITGSIKVVLKLLKGDWKGAWEEMRNTFSEIWNQIKALMEGLGDAFAGMFKIGLNEVFAVVNTAINKINEMISGLRKQNIIGSVIPDIKLPNIPKFAGGGEFVTNGQQLIMVGDNAGGRERVIIRPEGSSTFNNSDNRTNNSDNRPINIYISGNIGAEALASALAFQLKFS